MSGVHIDSCECYEYRSFSFGEFETVGLHQQFQIPQINSSFRALATFLSYSEFIPGCRNYVGSSLNNFVFFK